MDLLFESSIYSFRSALFIIFFFTVIRHLFLLLTTQPTKYGHLFAALFYLHDTFIFFCCIPVKCPKAAAVLKGKFFVESERDQVKCTTLFLKPIKIFASSFLDLVFQAYLKMQQRRKQSAGDKKRQNETKRKEKEITSRLVFESLNSSSSNIRRRRLRSISSQVFSLHITYHAACS